MHIASALSTLSTVQAIAQHIELQIKSSLASTNAGRPDLLMVFLTSSLAGSFEPLMSMLRGSLLPGVLVAVTAESILGGDKEVDRVPAVSALAISAPNAQFHGFCMA